MIITAPITDYIPASILTTEGDMVVRRAVNIERLGRVASSAVLRSSIVADYPNWTTLEGILNSYAKGTGAGSFPLFSALALRDTGIHIGTGTRNAAGDQVIAGVGFESSVIIFLATDNTGANMNWSIGFDNGTIHRVLFQGTNGTVITINSSYSMYIDRGGGNRLMADISVIGADGFTLTWVLFGACAVDFIYLCLP